MVYFYSLALDPSRSYPYLFPFILLIVDIFITKIRLPAFFKGSLYFSHADCMRVQLEEKKMKVIFF